VAGAPSAAEWMGWPPPFGRKREERGGVMPPGRRRSGTAAGGASMPLRAMCAMSRPLRAACLAAGEAVVREKGRPSPPCSAVSTSVQAFSSS